MRRIELSSDNEFKIVGFDLHYYDEDGNPQVATDGLIEVANGQLEIEIDGEPMSIADIVNLGEGVAEFANNVFLEDQISGSTETQEEVESEEEKLQTIEEFEQITEQKKQLAEELKQLEQDLQDRQQEIDRLTSELAQSQEQLEVTEEPAKKRRHQCGDRLPANSRRFG